MGRYNGGRLWIESRRHPPPNLPRSPLRGQYHETKYRWVMFDPKRFHAVEPCVGSRLSVGVQHSDLSLRSIRPFVYYSRITLLLASGAA
eukprot:2719137-Amphidinium_carterae.1